MRDAIFISIVSMILASAIPAFGESVTLREAIGRALRENHLVKAAALERGAAEKGWSAEKSRLLPRLVLDSGAALSNTPSRVFMMKLDEGRIDPATDFSADKLNHPDPRGDFSTSLLLEQPLVDPGIWSDVAIAGKNAESAALALQARREEIAFRAYLAYLAVRRAGAVAGIADQAVADAREHGRLAALREREGTGLKSDLLRARTEIDEAEQRVVAAKNDLLLARMRLNLVAGGREGEPLDISETPTLQGPAAEEDLVATALRERTELRLSGKELERGDLAVRKARSAYLPTLRASASYQINDRDWPLGRDKDSWGVGIHLRWELFDGGRRGNERGKAELSREAAAELLEEGRREVALQVTEAKLRREEAGLQIESARSALEAAQEGMRLVTLRFRNGLASIVELLDAEGALNRSRTNLVEVENRYLAATGELYLRAGVFLKEVMR